MLNDYALKIVTAKSQADKAINSLKGILQGILLDKEINDAEITELHHWTETHNHLISKNPFNEFMILILESTKGDIPKNEVIEDLFWLCQKYEVDNYYYNAITSELQILQGLCHGLLADGIISNEEIVALHKWLEENEHMNSYWPYDELRSLVLSIVSDQKIEDEERLMLIAFINQFVDLKNPDVRSQVSKSTSEIHLSGHCTSDPKIEFEGKTFCITGTLKVGSRSNLQKIISELGGIPVSSITRSTDYLIVGDNGNPAWAFSCYGRKVEKAIQLRKDGHTISLIHEFDFNDVIEDKGLSLN